MTTLTNRWYRDNQDLDRMLALARSAVAASGAGAGLIYPGDIVWGLGGNPKTDPATRVRLFEDERGELRGFVWLHPPRDFAIHQDTGRPLPVSDLVAMIRWAESQLEPGAPFGIDEVPAGDVEVALGEAGYRSTGEVTFNVNVQPLDGVVPEPELPPGAEVRPVNVDDAAEVAARVALHQEVWESKKFTGEGYAQLRQRPVYRPDLDLVAVTPAGELAAYCIVWWDPVTRTGEFEPVGASLAHRRRGYAKGLVRDGLARLQTLGAREAVVLSEGTAEREPSRRLYASTGFTVTYQLKRWEQAEAPGNP